MRQFFKKYAIKKTSPAENSTGLAKKYLHALIRPE
jgi:hypothetical protein